MFQSEVVSCNRISSPGRSVTDASHRKTRLPLVYCFYEPTDAYKNNRLVYKTARTRYYYKCYRLYDE